MKGDERFKVLTRPILNKLNVGSYIINIDDDLFDETQGTHWIGLIVVNKKTVLYFDAFGMYPITDIITLYPEVIYSDYQIQDLKSTACGYYCIAFLKNVKSIAKFRKFVQSFNQDPINNDNVLRKKYKLEVK
jgi:hypothetical protein